MDLFEMQQKCLERIFVVNEYTPFEQSNNSLIGNLLEFSKEEFDTAFGNIGKTFYNIFSKIDLSHPDSVLLVDHEMSQLALEALRLFRYVKESNSYERLPSLLTKFFYKNIVRDNMVLIKNSMDYVRLFNDPEMRKQVRLKDGKVVKALEYDQKHEYMDSSISIDQFIRNDNFCDSQIAANRRKIKVFEDRNLLTYVEKLKSLEFSFLDVFNDPVLGFQKIPLNILTILLAKALNCSITSNLLLHTNGAIFRPSLKSANFEVGSENMQRVFNHLENMPEYNNKPVFDAFYVLQSATVDVPEKTEFLIGSRKDSKVKYYFICLWENKQ